MRFAIAYGKDDPAGNNIVDRLKELAFLPQIPIIQLKKHPIYSEFPEKKHPELKNADFLVFASTHRSKAEKHSLSLHAPGNWRGADLGGEPGKACKTSAFVLKYLFQELVKNTKNSGNYEITLEVTHHGPLTEIPCCFIEIGSSEEQWRDKSAGLIIAKTILSLQDYKAGEWIPAIGLGGPHYAPNFNKIQLNSQYAISHIIPQYTLPLTTSMLQEAEQKTLEHIKEILVDWKGCGKSEERETYLNLIKKFGISYKRTSEISKLNSS
jgi:D-aminoacyl-tRNA deacylase